MDNVVKESRNKLGLMQKEFGEIFGISKFAISRIERKESAAPKFILNCSKSILRMSDEERTHFILNLLGLPKFDKSKICFADNVFGELLSPGDVVEILNVVTFKKSVEKVRNFSGVEFNLEGKTDKENLGHSGFLKCDDNGFYVCLNRTPILYVSKT